MTTTFEPLWGIICYEMRLQWRRRQLIDHCDQFCPADAGLYAHTAPINARHWCARTAVGNGYLLGVTIPVSHWLVGDDDRPATGIGRDHPPGPAGGHGRLWPRSLSAADFYLTGKVLGVWGSILMMVVVVAILGAVVARFTFGPFDIGSYLSVWLLGILPLALFVSATTVLLASRQPSRRRSDDGWRLHHVLRDAAALSDRRLRLVAGLYSQRLAAGSVSAGV